MNSKTSQDIRNRGDGGIAALIATGDTELAKTLAGFLAAAGIRRVRVSAPDAEETTAFGDYQLVLFDLSLFHPETPLIAALLNARMHDTHLLLIGTTEQLNSIDPTLKDSVETCLNRETSAAEFTHEINNALDKIALEREVIQLRKRLDESEALHRFIVRNSPDLLYVLDPQGHFTFLNKNALKALGYRSRELIGKHYTEVVHPRDVGRARLFFDKAIALPGPRKLELRLLGKNSKAPLHIETSALRIRRKRSGQNVKNDFLGVFGVARDIRQRKKAEEILHYQYNFDFLTGLPNRTLLKDRLKALINQSQLCRENFAVLYINVDRFRLFNEAYGQTLGDQLLQNISASLRTYTRESDTLARIGSDEFILLLPDIVDEKNAIFVADKIARRMSYDFAHEDRKIDASISVGIALYPDHGKTEETLINAADIAVCHARSHGRRYALYNSSLDNRRSTKLTVEALIKEALNEDRLVVHYQPQIVIPENRFCSAEALVRIQAPDGKLILPGEFIDIAEETGLVNEIGAVVVEKACRDIKNWNRQGIHIPVAFNVSAVQLAQEHFADTLLGRIRAHRIYPQEIEIELTENVLIQNMSWVVANLLKLANNGVRIAIDDFGSGYSSLNYLHHLPLHSLKLDKSFIAKINEENREDSIIPAMFAIARGLKLDFIVEGVASEIQHDYLCSLGSCIVQGFHYSRPVSNEVLLEYFETHQGRMNG